MGCTAYQSDFNGDYTVTVGMEVLASDRLSEYQEVKVEDGDYLVFKAEGEMPKVVVDTWQEIWQYFAKNNIQRKYATDFELYKSDNEVEIYISIL